MLQRFPLFLVPSILLTVTVAQATIIPAGTELQLRLVTEVSSDKPSGEPVAAVVIVPVFVNGVPAINAGSRVTGITADASAFRAATDQAQEHAATLRIEFTALQDETGRSKPLHSMVESVDNARESVDQTGLITGIAASQTLEGELDKGLRKLQSFDQQFAQLLSGVKGALLKDVDPSIDYKPGVELTIKLTKLLEWNASASPNMPAAIMPVNAVVALVNSEPSRTVALDPPKPSDVTNLMFIGSEQEIETAFHAAGWFAAEALSRSSKFETARALIEDRGYSEAPMSILYLDGKPPDFTFQKQNNTFAMRHHIRIWRRLETFNGKPVWVAAATHDVGITFSPVTHTFIHSIDSNIDLERAKVVNDLLFTGYVRALAVVGRSGIGRDASNATGDKLVTDGKMAVLEF